MLAGCAEETRNTRTLYRLGLVVGLALAGLVLLWGVLVPSAHASPPLDGPAPLPRECGGVNPPGYPVPTCCLFGYVPYASATLTEPLVAHGAAVTLTTPEGMVTHTVTAPGWHNGEGLPYFHFDLDAAGVEAGDAITLTASYGGKSNLVIYQVITGGQQVDVVLPESPVTLIVDEQDPAFSITGTVELLTEADCGPGTDFWEGAIYSATTTAGGLGPPTVSAVYRPDIPISGTYELFAYNPDGCVAGFATYRIHLGSGEVLTTLVDQGTAGQNPWVSLGVFDFPAGTGSYVELTNFTGQPVQTPVGFDALKWELQAPRSVFETITVDDLDTANFPWEAGFYKNDVVWGVRTTGCDGSVLDPIYWENHIYFTFSIIHGPPVNWAHWRADLSTPGLYALYVFVPVCYATARAPNYRVYIGSELIDQVTIDQALQGSVWVPLGTYELPAGTSSRVYLDDVTGTADEHIAYDAVRWVRRPHFRPLATIHSIRPGSAIQGEDVVVLRGSGVDTDHDGENVVAYEWRSNVDGILGSVPEMTIPADALSAGTHVITFRVQDDEGLWSEAVSTHLEVQRPGPEESWHFMLYFAGDNNLSYYFNRSLERVQALSLAEGVTVTVLYDRPGGSGLRRYAIHPGGVVTSSTLPEADTGDPETLASYLLWAQETHPAHHYYLAIADHGRGIQGTAWDDHSGGDYLTLPELRAALQQGTDNGALKIDVLHLDACLMGMIEVGYELSPFADYLVASENIAWALFGYEGYVQVLGPSTTPRELAQEIAQSYHVRVDAYPHTISVMDLGQMGDLVGRVDTLSGALLNALPTDTLALSMTLAQVQRFDSRDYGEIDESDEFVDLFHFSQLLETLAQDQGVRVAARGVLSSTVVLTEHHVSGFYGTWWDLEHAHGVSIYFPPTSGGWDYPYYVSPTLQFGHDARWDELLVAVLGLPPTPPDEPLPPPVPALHHIYLPLILRGSS